MAPKNIGSMGKKIPMQLHCQGKKQKSIKILGKVVKKYSR